MTRTSFFIIFLTGFLHKSHAQMRVDAGLLPSLNFIVKKQDYAFNFRIESRQFMYEKNRDEKSTLNYDYGLTDFTGLATKKIDFDKTLALGYLLRLESDEIIHRTIQQLIITKKWKAYKLTHRYRPDVLT